MLRGALKGVWFPGVKLNHIKQSFQPPWQVTPFISSRRIKYQGPTESKHLIKALSLPLHILLHQLHYYCWPKQAAPVSSQWRIVNSNTRTPKSERDSTSIYFPSLARSYCCPTALKCYNTSTNNDRKCSCLSHTYTHKQSSASEIMFDCTNTRNSRCDDRKMRGLYKKSL